MHHLISPTGLVYVASSCLVHTLDGYNQVLLRRMLSTASFTSSMPESFSTSARWKHRR